MQVYFIHLSDNTIAIERQTYTFIDINYCIIPLHCGAMPSVSHIPFVKQTKEDFPDNVKPSLQLKLTITPQLVSSELFVPFDGVINDGQPLHGTVMFDTEYQNTIESLTQ